MTNEDRFENTDFDSLFEEETPILQEKSESTPKQQKGKPRTVRLPVLVACILIAALLGGVLGAGLIRMFGRPAQPLETPPVNNLEIKEPNSASEPQTTPDNAADETKTPPSQQLSSGLVSATKPNTVQECADTIVGIDVTMGDVRGNSTTASGSGVIITPTGYILTCAHVIENGQDITVYINDGTTYSAKLIGSDTQTDLAVLKIEAANLPYATFGSSDSVSLGEAVIAIGNPLGVLLNSVSSGIISGLDREITMEDGRQMTLLQTDASINSGNSGGGLFNNRGELIGIVNAKNIAVGIEGLGFAIPADLAKDIASDLMDQGFISGRPYLGVTIQEIRFTYRNRNDQNPLGGYGYFNDIFGSMQSYETRVQIMEIQSGSAAEREGLQVNDIILKINGAEITSSNQFTAEINRYKAGDTITVTVQRGAQNVDLSITLGEKTH